MEEDFYKKLKEIKEGQITSGGQIGSEGSSNQIPSKIKFVAWWKSIIGGILGFIGLALLPLLIRLWMTPHDNDYDFLVIIPVFVGVPLFLFYFLPGFFLLKGNLKRALNLNIIIDSIILGIIIILCFYYTIREQIFLSRLNISSSKLIIMYILGYLILSIPFFLPLILLIKGKKELENNK